MAVTVLLILLGAFYVFAGLVATRAGLTSRLLDQAISAISLKKPDAAEVMRTRIGLAIAALTFLGGVLLMARLDLALPAFLACAGLQAAYLFVIAPRWLDPKDPPSATGRRQTINAFVVYLAATAVVGWAWATDKLVAAVEAPWPVLAAIVAALAAYGLYVAQGSMGKPRPPA